MNKTFKNKFGTDIKMCCASCIHNERAVNLTHRFCNNGEGEVHFQWLCRAWQMNPKLADAGCAGGGVKKREYLMYVYHNVRFKPLTLLRRDWERKNGSIYINKPL